LTCSFSDFSGPVPVPTSFSSGPAALNVEAFSFAAHSAALWLNPPQYRHLPSVNLFALSSAEILLLPALRSRGAGPVYPATIPVGAPAGLFGGA